MQTKNTAQLSPYPVMDDVAIIIVLTMVTINVCGMVYIGKIFTQFICKVIHYMKLVDKEGEQ